MMLNRVALAGLLFGLTGVGACTTVRVQPVGYLQDNAPRVVWVTYTNNTVVLVAEPVIKRDTLRGTLQGERIKIPLAEIRSVQVKMRDRTKTALLLTTVGVAAVSSVFLFAQTGGAAGAGGVYCGTDTRGRADLFC